MIQHIRLINGDEIIGDVISVSEKTITIDNPLHVEERVNDMGYASIVLTKYIPFSQYKVCELQKQHVITTTELDPAIQKYYYLSLKINKNIEKNMIDDINQVNIKMEQALNNAYLYEKDEYSNTHIIHKGSSSIN